MPAGHTVHRIANEFNQRFGGRGVRVDSPQGRFGDSKLLDGRVLREATAVGKQMFLDFGDDLIVRIHLGIYGKWKFVDGEVPPVTGQVRVRFMSANQTAELRGPTVCEVIGAEGLGKVQQRLGPDPLNPDPDGREFKRFARRVSKTATSIGLLLMNQEVVSGIGNVYRAEILFRAKINPHTPGNALKPRQIKQLWDDSVMLLEVGVRHGVMITRDEFLDEDPGKSDRNWVYKREGQPCRRCKKKIVLEMAAGRKLYWCPGCQK